MIDYNLEKRRFVIGGVAIVIVVTYLIRLFTLQIMSDDYKKNADSNAFLKQIEYPSRGAIYDRNGKLMVYNQPSYDIMVVMNEEKNRLDTMDFCNALGITKEFFIKRMEDIKDRSKNPGYSRYTQQLFMTQLSDKDFSVFQEKMFRFPGFYVQKRSIREYTYPYAAHVLGDVGEVSESDIEDDSYYQPGDYIGKLGLEKHYEKELRGQKGVKIMLRDARGRIQGSYQNGKFDQKPIAGKDLTLGIDVKLQALGERLMQGKIGSIVAIDPRTGEVLAMVSSPTYDPRRLVGKQRGRCTSGCLTIRGNHSSTVVSWVSILRVLPSRLRRRLLSFLRELSRQVRLSLAIEVSLTRGSTWDVTAIHRLLLWWMLSVPHVTVISVGDFTI